jgi:biopolymer transport protein TolQ
MDAATATASFSFLDLFVRADWVVKFVMIGLTFASVWSWAVAVDKWLQIRRLEQGARLVEATLAEGRGIDGIEDSGKQGEAMARVVAVGMAEARAARRSTNQSEGAISRAVERMERVIQAAIARELAKAERGLAVLATIGSASPFIGLFGTVWGIMNAFRAIAESRNTNLAAVAPGIAEALFATALGLIAAIPAVIFSNWLSGGLDRFAVRLEALTDDVIARVSRRLQDPS